MQPANCLNCGETIDVHFHFCPNCGQKTALHRLSLKEVGHDAVHYVTHADKGIFSLLKKLAVRPGVVAREYVAGKRKNYFPPLNFFLITAAFFLLSAGIVQRLSANRTPYPQSRTEQVRQQGSDQTERIRKANIGKFMATYGNLLPISAIPLISFLIWLVYVRGRYNYTEHLIANMYIGGFSIAVYALFIYPFIRSGIGQLALAVYFVFEVVYRSISYYHFMNRGTRASAIKAVLVNMLALFGWGALTSYLISVYIKSGFWGFVE